MLEPFKFLEYFGCAKNSFHCSWMSKLTHWVDVCENENINFPVQENNNAIFTVVWNSGKL